MPSPSLPPSLEVSCFADHTVVRVVGCDSLNEYNSQAFGRELSLLIEEHDCLRLHLDLDGIRYATSTALVQLVGLNRTLRETGGHLVLLNPEPAVVEALVITRLDTILEIRPRPSDVPGPGGLPA